MTEASSDLGFQTVQNFSGTINATYHIRRFHNSTFVYTICNAVKQPQKNNLFVELDITRNVRAWLSKTTHRLCTMLKGIFVLFQELRDHQLLSVLKDAWCRFLRKDQSSTCPMCCCHINWMLSFLFSGLSAVYIFLVLRSISRLSTITLRPASRKPNANQCSYKTVCALELVLTC